MNRLEELKEEEKKLDLRIQERDIERRIAWKKEMNGLKPTENKSFYDFIKLLFGGGK